MTVVARREALAKNKKVQMMWQVTLGLQIFMFLIGIYKLIRYLGDRDTSVLFSTGIGLTGLVLFSIILSIGFSVAILWAMYRLEGWVVWLLWLGFISSLLSFDIIALGVAAFSLYAYTQALKVLKASAAPTQPQTPAV